MQTEAAVLWEKGGEWQVEQVELDPPGVGEVLVRMAASGMCHSDEHLVTGDLPMPMPVIGGHEGAGVVEAVGPGVVSLAPGDHVVTSFLPSCGRCPMCVTGHSNLCDQGAHTQVGLQLSDGTSRHHVRGHDARLFCVIGTFGHHTVANEWSFVKIDDDVPLDRACLVACGVATGWGSAVNRAEVRAGEDVVVVGVGGVGASAVQGARLAGAGRIFAVDPVPFKLEQAKRFGATHTASSIDEARELIAGETWGRMCHKAIMTMGVGRGELVASIMALVGKRGRAVLTNMHPVWESSVALRPMDLLSLEKELVGCLYGSSNMQVDVPRLLRLYRQGHLDLDGMVTRTYALGEINQGYQDMRDGKNIRGVIRFE